MKTKIAGITDLKKKYADAKAILKPTARQATQRGYDLESMLEYLLQPLEGRASYKADSEQIDGSFFYHGQTFLFEAKWHADPLPVSAIYNFRGKVDGKFHTTSGVFIAINGFSSDAVTALRYGKIINVLLFDGSDLDAIIQNDVPFEQVLKFKLRSAGDTGSPNAAYNLLGKAAVKMAAPLVLSGTTMPGIPSEPMDPYLVFYSSSFKAFNIESVFAQMDTREVIGFRFDQLSSSENPLDVIPVLVNLYLTSEQELEPRGILIVMDPDNDSKQLIADLRFNLPDILEKASLSLEVTIFELNADQVNSLVNYPPDIENLPGLRKILSYLEDHIDSGNLFYDDSAAYKAVKIAMQEAQWNYSEKTLDIRETNSREEQKEITSWGDLAIHLEEIAIDAGSEETPIEILKEDHRPDYSEIVDEVMDQYKTELKKMGW